MGEENFYDLPVIVGETMVIADSLEIALAIQGEMGLTHLGAVITAIVIILLLKLSAVYTIRIYEDLLIDFHCKIYKIKREELNIQNFEKEKYGFMLMIYLISFCGYLMMLMPSLSL